VRIHVEHPGVRVAEEPEPGVANAADCARRVDPVADDIPGGIAVEKRPRHRPVGDACAREGSGELGHAAGRAVREPFAGRHPFVVDGARRLQVEHDDGRLRLLHRGEHLRRGRIRRRVEHHQLHARRGELRTRLARLLRAVDEARRDDLCAELRQPALEVLLIALEPFAQAVELRPVRRQADPEHADPRGHPLSAGACEPMWRRASSLRNLTRARRTRSAALGTITLAISRPPTTMFWSCDETRSSVSAVCRQPRIATARSTPTIVPRPPKIDTPPRRTIVTTKSSWPMPESYRAEAKRSVQGSPANALRGPERTKSQNLIRFTRMPA